MRFLYQTGIAFYVLAIKIAALFNGKAKLWVDGRKEAWLQLAQIPQFEGKTVWVHCASLGEFEQGRPVIENIKKSHPQTRIILTFFSPSGYEVRKNYAQADYIFYLPADLPNAATKFFEAVKPDVGIIVKYEFWQGYLHKAKSRNIPLFLISGIFRKEMLFFKPWGNYFRKGLEAFHHFFVQDENSRELLRHIGIKNITACGDTRLDRVLEAVNNRTSVPIIEKFKASKLLWVCGSSWPVDDQLIIPIAEKYKGELKILLVPHDIHADYIDKLIISNKNLSIIKFSEAGKQDITQANVLILDTVGMLMSAYAYADFVYVGGGFGKAVHNTMEPAAYGIPILFGPKHKKFKEIGDLIRVNGGKCVHNSTELDTIVHELMHSITLRESMGNAAKKYVENHSGATSIIMRQLANYLN